MPESLIAESMELLVYGMGTVIVFLVTLILCIVLMSRIINYYAGSTDEITSIDQPACGPITQKKIKILQKAIEKHLESQKP